MVIAVVLDVRYLILYRILREQLCYFVQHFCTTLLFGLTIALLDKLTSCLISSRANAHT